MSRKSWLPFENELCHLLVARDVSPAAAKVIASPPRIRLGTIA